MPRTASCSMATRRSCVGSRRSSSGSSTWRNRSLARSTAGARRTENRGLAGRAGSNHRVAEPDADDVNDRGQQRTRPFGRVRVKRRRVRGSEASDLGGLGDTRAVSGPDLIANIAERVRPRLGLNGRTSLVRLGQEAAEMLLVVEALELQRAVEPGAQPVGGVPDT